MAFFAARRLMSAAPTQRLLTAAPVRRTLCAGTAAAASGTMQASTAQAGGGILGFARTQPYKFNIIVATLKTAACDYLVQRYMEGREQINWKRNAVFAAFGCVYLGGMQWFIYVDVFKKLWPGMAAFAAQPLREKLANPAGIRALFGQVAFDNFVHYPLIYFPVFYVFKETIQGESADALSAIPNGMSKYATNAVEDNLAMWALWIPGDLIVYAVPLWMRLPLNHGLSFIWTCYLSFVRGEEVKVEVKGSVASDAEALNIPAERITSMPAATLAVQHTLPQWDRMRWERYHNEPIAGRV